MYTAAVGRPNSRLGNPGHVMFQWTQNSALAEMAAILAEIQQLQTERRMSAAHSRWLARTLRVLEQVFGPKSRYYLSIANLSWAENSTFVIGGPGDPEGAWNPQASIERRHQDAYLRQLDMARGLLLAAVDELERAGLENVYEGKDTGPEASAILRILTLTERSLRKGIRGKPDRERDVQDAFETLLIGAEIPYSRETDSITYSSKTYTPDFTFTAIDLVVELKLCNRDGREKEIIAEINDDILAYKVKYGNIIFAVYDLGYIRDVDLFTRAFESHEGVVVRVIKQ